VKENNMRKRGWKREVQEGKRKVIKWYEGWPLCSLPSSNFMFVLWQEGDGENTERETFSIY
jgi:hypothetical protein